MSSRKTLRDESSSLSDRNAINIDFDGDGNKAYILAVSLADSLFDAIKLKKGGFKTDWDGDWIAKTKKYDGYWISEFYIPRYIKLRYPCLLYTSPSPRDGLLSRMPSSA